MSGCAAKLFAVLAPSADTAAVMCAYGGQLPIVTPFIVGCVGAYTPKRCQAIIGLIIVLAQTQKVLDDQRSADVLTHPRSCKYSQQRATTCWPDLCNSAQILLQVEV